jgi:hypothetical protein
MVEEKRIFVDFDGVINSFQSGQFGWQGGHGQFDGGLDPPVEGAGRFLIDLVDHGWEVYIFSVRLNDPEQIEVVAQYLLRVLLDELGSRDLGMKYLRVLKLTNIKLHAHVYLDDRGWRFNGTFPSLKELEEFRPWWKKE